ncbi:MAG TPA: DNA polymerase III subunit delta' [Gammaproteobacteria bacterium]|nr:DNA polymerase III subunit delta' [Gammaproteobacteria bacterium]
MTGLLPWHQALWRHTAARLQAGRMPHALLLGGPRGIGKHRFAEHLARAALCEAPDAQGGGCGQCRQCHLTLAGTHPDWRRVSPEEEGKDILVDQIRELTQHLGLKAQMGGYKVAVIEPAGKMNMNAANCLLKSLEEPPAATLLVLVSARPASLPATIRSRCQKLLLGPPPREQALAWLNEQGVEDPALALTVTQGAPLAALALAQGDEAARREALLGDFTALAEGRSDPVQIAAKWLKLNINSSLYWMYTWLIDMIRIKAVGNTSVCINPDYRGQLAKIAEKMEITSLFHRLDQLQGALRRVDRPVNKQLLLEDLLLPWTPNPARHRG